MSEPTPQGGTTVTGSVRGDVSGQVAIGTHIRQSWQVGVPAGPPTEAEVAELRRALDALRAEAAAAAPTPEAQAEAVGKVAELEQAVLRGAELEAGVVKSAKPNLLSMEYLKGWFADNLPGVVGSVTSVVVHPVVGKLVTAAGDAAVAEFKRRFGG